MTPGWPDRMMRCLSDADFVKLPECAELTADRARYAGSWEQTWGGGRIGEVHEADLEKWSELVDSARGRYSAACRDDCKGGRR